MMRQATRFRELAVAGGITVILVVLVWSIVYAQRLARDKVAIRTAERVATDLQHYAARHGGTYPQNIGGHWPGIMTRLEPDNELPVKPAPAIFKTWADDEGDYIQGYSDAHGSMYQLLFRVAGGTGKVYCRDPKGMGPVASSLFGTSGPWTGCPSTPVVSAKGYDKAAIELAAKVAANLQHYAARHGGAYPQNISGHWPSIMTKLAPDNELPVKPAPAIFKTWAEDEGDYIQGYSDANGSTYQLLFQAAGGTGKAYCRDPKGTAPVAPSLFGKPGPWAGCP